MFASDIHGSSYYCEKMIEAYKKEKADRLVLLGDLLYHGPRNDLPREYEPKKVIAMLNYLREDICAIRGNCDAEVDQMVLEFPIMAEYCIILYENHTIYASHGHNYNYENLPPIKSGDIFIQGHTHIWKAENLNGNILLNPGSISLPKENNEQTYGIIENGEFLIKNFDNEIVKKLKL